MNEKALKEFFEEHPRCALAFSGGVDSAFLLAFAAKHGFAVRAYYIRTAFQPAFEYRDARRLAQQLGIRLHVLELDVLRCPEIVENPANRCYFCKTKLFSTLCEAAKRDGCTAVLDGTNASDRSDDRPGMRALREMHVYSPLRDCGYTKREIREQSERLGLFTAQKPSYACLATRIPTDTPITAQDLHRVECAETLVADMGFRDFRLRCRAEGALFQVSAVQMERAQRQLEDIRAAVKPYFCAVQLDPIPRKPEESRH